MINGPASGSTNGTVDGMPRSKLCIRCSMEKTEESEWHDRIDLGCPERKVWDL